MPHTCSIYGLNRPALCELNLCKGFYQLPMDQLDSDKAMYLCSPIWEIPIHK